MLAPRLLAQRASNVEGSLELLMLAPAALLARRYVAANHQGMPPPLGPRRLSRWLRWAWLLEGAAQYFSGQVHHVRPAVTRRMREGGAPSFPPGRRGRPRCSAGASSTCSRARRASAPAWRSPAGRTATGRGGALEAAFRGRPLRHTEAAWRSHLARLGEPAPRRRARDGRPRSVSRPATAR